ncbi:hypothetical protein [Shewanella woodyi]|uniref:hypothetical protein n=1 Tax=Shewanella woodyi TaxID=60961 RepID=UPI003749CB3F
MLNFVSQRFNSFFHLTGKSFLLMPVTLFLSASVMASDNPSEAELAFNKEVLECASYYQISSNVIVNMDAPQMKPVGERLLNSSKKAIALAEQYQSKDAVEKQLSATKEKQLATLPNGKSLGPLMSKYKVACQSLLSAPQKRLDYWIMATM